MSDATPPKYTAMRRDGIFSGRRDLMRAVALGGLGLGTGVATGAALSADDAAPTDATSATAWSIVEFGADTAATDNKHAIERSIRAAMKADRALFVPPGTFSFSQLDFGKNDAVSPTRLLLCGPGTLRSVHRGTAIVASEGQFYDLVIDGLRFESQENAGTTLIDGGAFFRLTLTPGTQVSDFDWTIRSAGSLQSVRMTGCIVRGGRGAVVKARTAYDCVFAHNIIEFTTDGIVIDGDGDPAVHTCRIEGNLLEGLGGRAIVLGACLASSVSGNYLEGNTGGDIALNAGTAAHKGLRVQANSIQMPPARLAAGAYGIIWGKSTALPVRAGANYCNGRLHDTRGTTSIIDMSGDFAAGELYSGFKPEGIANRAPLGRAIYTDGLTWQVAWFDRHLTLDPHNNEIRFGGAHDSTVAGSVEAPVVTFGTTSPAENPAGFDRKGWARGSIVFNAAAAEGQPTGWICVEPGTTGKWINI